MADPDARFSLANERTYLAWMRTALAAVAGGLAAAKALEFDHELARWLISAPPVLAGAVLAARAPKRWRATQDALAEDRPIPVGHTIAPLGFGLAAYAILALVVVALD